MGTLADTIIPLAGSIGNDKALEIRKACDALEKRIADLERARVDVRERLMEMNDERDDLDARIPTVLRTPEELAHAPAVDVPSYGTFEELAKRVAALERKAIWNVETIARSKDELAEGNYVTLDEIERRRAARYGAKCLCPSDEDGAHKWGCAFSEEGAPGARANENTVDGSRAASCVTAEAPRKGPPSTALNTGDGASAGRTSPTPRDVITEGARSLTTAIGVSGQPSDGCGQPSPSPASPAPLRAYCALSSHESEACPDRPRAAPASVLLRVAQSFGAKGDYIVWCGISGIATFHGPDAKANAEEFVASRASPASVPDVDEVARLMQRAPMSAFWFRSEEQPWDDLGEGFQDDLRAMARVAIDAIASRAPRAFPASVPEWVPSANEISEALKADGCHGMVLGEDCPTLRSLIASRATRASTVSVAEVRVIESSSRWWAVEIVIGSRSFRGRDWENERLATLEADAARAALSALPAPDAPKLSPCCLCTFSTMASCECECHKTDHRAPKPWEPLSSSMSVTDREIMGDAPKPALSDIAKMISSEGVKDGVPGLHERLTWFWNNDLADIKRTLDDIWRATCGKDAPKPASGDDDDPLPDDKLTEAGKAYKARLRAYRHEYIVQPTVLDARVTQGMRKEAASEAQPKCGDCGQQHDADYFCDEAHRRAAAAVDIMHGKIPVPASEAQGEPTPEMVDAAASEYDQQWLLSSDVSRTNGPCSRRAMRYALRAALCLSRAPSVSLIPQELELGIGLTREQAEKVCDIVAMKASRAPSPSIEDVVDALMRVQQFKVEGWNGVVRRADVEHVMRALFAGRSK